MSWSISSRGISRISNFVEAERHWNNAVPWRNEDASWRQLDGRRMTHKRLVKLSDNRGYECVLYNTPVVTYMADGSVLLDTYNSQSTQVFAWVVKPTGCAPASTRGRMFWDVRTDAGNMYYQPGKERLRLAPTDKGNWLLTSEPVAFTEQQYNPKLGAAVRKKLKAYTLWFDMTQRLGAHIPLIEPWKRNMYNVKAIRPDEFHDPEAFAYIAKNVGDPKYVRSCLYLEEGAHFRAPAPFDRLPRIFT